MDSNDGSRIYVYRSWVRWLPWLMVFLVVPFIAWLIVSSGVVSNLVIPQNADIDVMLEPSVKWSRGIQFTLGDPMTMDTSECEDGDYLSFVRNSNGRLVLVCTSGDEDDDVQILDK